MSLIFNIENYPSEYHLGISLIFWIILIAEYLIIAIIRFSQGRKDRLVNRKEMFYGIGFAYLGGGLFFIVAQFGIFNPKYFAWCISIGLTALQFTFIFFVYYWEKNLISLRKVPTMVSISIFLMAFVDMFFILTTNSTALEFFEISYVFFIVFIQFIFLFVLIIVFAKRVVGNLRIRAISILLGFFFVIIGALFDHPPLVFSLPNIFTILTPIFFIIGNGVLYYGTSGICEGLSAFYNQEQKCIVHRGFIPKGTSIYYCPSCNTTYCKRCYEEVVKKDGCWNCGQGIKSTQEKEWESKEVQIIDSKKKVKADSPK